MVTTDHQGFVGAAVKRYLISQFRHPRGPMGRLAGWIMASRGSNRKRNAWTIDLLDLQPTHRVLEIGHGPGLASNSPAGASRVAKSSASIIPRPCTRWQERETARRSRLAG